MAEKLRGGRLCAFFGAQIFELHMPECKYALNTNSVRSKAPCCLPYMEACKLMHEHIDYSVSVMFFSFKSTELWLLLIIFFFIIIVYETVLAEYVIATRKFFFDKLCVIKFDWLFHWIMATAMSDSSLYLKGKKAFPNSKKLMFPAIWRLILTFNRCVPRCFTLTLSDWLP